MGSQGNLFFNRALKNRKVYKLKRITTAQLENLGYRCQGTTEMKSYFDGYKLNGYFVLKYKPYVPIDSMRYAIPGSHGRHRRAYHENQLADHIFETIYQSDSKKSFLGGDIDDIFQDRLDLIRSKIELILLQLDQRKKINQEILSQIEKDSCQAQNLIFALGHRAYLMDRDRLTLEKVKFDLEAQKRMEEANYFRDTGLLNKDLKDTLIQYLSENQKGSLIRTKEEKI